MNKKSLIVGSGTYGVVASEIVSEMRCFEKSPLLMMRKS